MYRDTGNDQTILQPFIVILTLLAMIIKDDSCRVGRACDQTWTTSDQKEQKLIRQEQKRKITDGKFTICKISKSTIDDEDGAVALQPNPPPTSTFRKYSN